MKKYFLPALLFLSAFSFAQSQQNLNLSDAIKYALEHKADAQKSRLNIEKSKQTIAEVRANALPQISATGNLLHNLKLKEAVFAGMPGMPQSEVLRIKMGQDWTAQGNLQLTQVIFNQAVFMGLKAARTTKEFYELNHQLTENQVIEKVAEAYYRVYQAQETLKNIETNLNLTQKTFNVISGLYNSGLAKKIDLDRVSVAINNLKSAQIQAQTGVELTTNALKYMIGMPIETQIILDKNAFEVDYAVALQSGNHQDRIELQLLEKQKKLLETNIKAKASDYFPSLALVANYGFLGQGPKIPLFYGEKDKVYWSDFSAVGLSLNIPIFKGFSTRAKVRQAKFELENLETDIKDTRLALDLAYINAQSQLNNSLLTIESQKENLKLAQEVLENTQNNYEQGLASLTDLLSSERSLSESQNAYNNAMLQHKLAEIELLKAQGNLKSLIK